MLAASLFVGNAAVDLRKAAAMAPDNSYAAALVAEVEAGEPPGGPDGQPANGFLYRIRELLEAADFDL